MGFWSKIQIEGRDIIALVVVLGGLILLAMGINTVVGSLLLMVVAFYFGERAVQGRKK